MAGGGPETYIPVGVALCRLGKTGARNLSTLRSAGATTSQVVRLKILDLRMTSQDHVHYVGVISVESIAYKLGI